MSTKIVTDFLTDSSKFQMMSWPVANKSKRISFKNPSSVVILVPMKTEKPKQKKPKAETKVKTNLDASVNKQITTAKTIRKKKIPRDKLIKGVKKSTKIIQTTTKKQKPRKP